MLRQLSVLLAGLGLIVGFALLPSYAQPAAVLPTATPPTPPIGAYLPDSGFVVERFTTGSGERALPCVISAASEQKAVVIVGPVGSSTQTYINDAEKAAQVLEANDFQVERLYHPNATWDAVKEKMPGAQVVVYQGHGSTSYGFALTSDPNNANTCHVVSQQASRTTSRWHPGPWQSCEPLMICSKEVSPPEEANSAPALVLSYYWRPLPSGTESD